MVREQLKKSFGKNLDYARSGQLIERAASLLSAKWKREQPHHSAERRLKEINRYAQTIAGDIYLSNAWLIWEGCKREDSTLGTASSRIEHLRTMLQTRVNLHGQPLMKNLYIPEAVFDPSNEGKMKPLFRFLIAKRLARALHEESGIPGLSETGFYGDPFMFASQLSSILCFAVA